MICLPEQVSDAGFRQNACRAFLFALACSCCLFFSPFSIHAQDVLPEERQKSLEELLREPPRECLPVREISPGDCAFDEGERLEFSVRYVWGILDSEVGKASATVAEAEGGSGVPLYHCIAEGRTSRFFDMFFKVRERFESWFRQSDMRPLVSSRDTYEGGYEARNNYRWIRPGEQIEADVYTTRLGDTSMVLSGTECTFDLVSLFYFARNLDFSNYEEPNTWEDAYTNTMKDYLNAKKLKQAMEFQQGILGIDHSENIEVLGEITCNMEQIINPITSKLKQGMIFFDDMG